MNDLESLTVLATRISSQEDLLSIIESQQQQIEKLREELKTIRECRRSWSVEWLLSEADTMETQLEELQRENRKLTEQIETLKSDLQKAESKLNRTLSSNEREIKEAVKKEHDQQYVEHRREIVKMEEMHKEEIWKLTRKNNRLDNVK